jgi:GntR family transcriptional regulator
MLAMTARPNDFTPLYVHISRYLRALILDGELAAGDAIPSETDLVKKFGTTRGTVRSAVDVLVNEKLVQRVHGKGTFVQARPIRHDIWDFGGFTDSLGDQAALGVAKVISTRNLDLEGRTYFELVRLRGIKVGDEIDYLSLDTSWIPLNMFPGIDDVDFEDRSLYELFRKTYDTHPRRTAMTLTAEVIDDTERRLLKEKSQDALLVAHGSAFDQNDIEIERIKSVYSSRIQFNFTTAIADPEEWLK